MKILIEMNNEWKEKYTVLIIFMDHDASSISDELLGFNFIYSHQFVI